MTRRLRHWIDATRLRLFEQPHLLILLVAWTLSVVAPALHDDSDGADRHVGGHSASHCPGVATHRHAEDCARGPELKAGCNAANCQDPTHHHHAAYHHDATHCPSCASAFERATAVTVFVLEVASRPAFVTDASFRVPNFSERCVFSLARGPPPARSLMTVGTAAV